MKSLSGLLLVLILAFTIPLSQTVYAKRIMVCHKTFYYKNGHRYYTYCRFHCYKPCTICYPNPNLELDNACVDACIDLKHTLNHCMRSCYY